MGDAMGDPRGRVNSGDITMSYTTHKIRYAEPMGDALSDLMKCGKGLVGTVLGGAVDPYLPEAICRVSQLQALSKGRTPLQALFGKKPTVAVPTCANTPPGQKGMGLEKAIKPLRALVYVNQHPTVMWAGLTALLVVPMLVGYMIGRKTR
jgi:hypothetical protein